MTEKILFVQLSDIHIRTSEDIVLKRAKAIAAATFPRLPEVLGVAILITGDIAFSGTAAEYALATKFISEIKTTIEAELKDRSVNIFVCPGNHDCNFKLDNDTRDAVLAMIRSDENAPTDSLISTATAVQKEFFDFRDQVSPQTWKVDTPLSWQSVLRVGHRRVGIRSLNVAWMSKLKEKQGMLVFPPSSGLSRPQWTQG
ncbi:metallophosphoesterase family protein [Herminiimonas contaminans]|uniref:Metallophosphoesterase n=1 Tax=Herminiimonas contaminans TaxID=1111140 RepID=A0ABS0EY09_9BURK|nr:metallophosphoesterase [Herminiimonas contaminans]MBF8179716.1 metallophosphoesterase [Herminiimonas contaminans]